MKSGDRVRTVDGRKGIVAWVRMDIRGDTPEAASVLLDDQKNRLGYHGSMFHVDDLAVLKRFTVKARVTVPAWTELHEVEAVDEEEAKEQACMDSDGPNFSEPWATPIWQEAKWETDWTEAAKFSITSVEEEK